MIGSGRGAKDTGRLLDLAEDLAKLFNAPDKLQARIEGLNAAYAKAVDERAAADNAIAGADRSKREAREAVDKAKTELAKLSEDTNTRINAAFVAENDAKDRIDAAAASHRDLSRTTAATNAALAKRETAVQRRENTVAAREKDIARRESEVAVAQKAADRAKAEYESKRADILRVAG